MCLISGDQSEISSNCPSRKGSTFSVVNRQSNSITPSTSSHHITVSSRDRDMDASTGNATKDVDKSFGTNHSLDRGHSHSHSHSHHHHHHHSLDRDSAHFTNHSNQSCSASSTRGQFCTNTPPSSSVVAKSRSSTSNNSLTLSNHNHSSEEQLNQHRKSNIDASGSVEWNDGTTGCSRGGSDRSRPMMKPPKDPKSSNHHHSRHKLNDEHPHQQHHHQHQHRKKSIGSVGDPDGGSLGGMRKISAAGSVSSVLSENSMGSHSKSRTNSNDFSHKMPAN